MTTLASHLAIPQADKESFKEKTGRLCDTVEERLARLLKRHALFHMAFFILGALEVFSIATFFFLQSSGLAIALASIFLTAFSYFVLRLYLHTKKREQIINLRDLYIQSCKSYLHYQEGVSEHHLALANGVCKLASTLHDEEYNYYQLPSYLEGLQPALSKLSCFVHWRDVLIMRELLLLFAIDEYVKLVKCEPTTMEIHASLANAYVMLSCLYIDPKRSEDEQWTPQQRYSEQMQARFEVTAKRAVEELNILSAYAPNDPWVHEQLAYSYHDLQMPEEEIKEYEAILSLQPEDMNILFKLGIRYFQQGHNAKGLQVYDELKRRRHLQAEELMRFYGASLPPSLSEEA